MLAALVLLIAATDMDPSVSVCDHHRFPWSASECERNWKFAKAHVEWLKANHYDPDWLTEAEFMHACWDELDNAKRYFWSNPHAQRGSLARLREYIGERNYWLGIMPPVAPHWRFRDLR